MPSPDAQTYTNQVLKLVVAQICHTLGFNSVQSTPMEVMVDVLHNYMREICKLTKDYAELYNRIEPNIDDVALAYREMKINPNELKEYIDFIDPIACPIQVPKYPLPKDSHLNFLKPGSQEVLTRPNHIPDYLPPMQPPEEEEELPTSSNDTDIKPTTDELNLNGQVEIKEEQLTSPLPQTSDAPFFKKPPDVVDRKVKFEQEGRPVREISSVMMTTSGFISPAREGKLPDAKPPVIIPDKRQSPPPPPPVTAPLPVTSLDNKFDEKPAKKKDKEEKKKKVKKEHAPTSSVSTPMVPPAPVNPPILSPAPIPSTSGSVSKPLPAIPPHSIASHVSPTIPVAVRPITPHRKPGRPPKNRAPDGTPLPAKPKKPKDPDAKVLKQLKKQMTAGHLPHMPEHQLMEMLKKFKQQQERPPPSQLQNPSSILPAQAHQFLTGQSPLPPYPSPLQFPSPNKFNPSIPTMMPDGKLPSEPDKSKLNFFKKIPKISNQLPTTSNDFNSPVMPRMEPSARHIDEITPPMSKKRPEFLDSPINMSMNRSHQSDFGRSPNEELGLPKTPQFMPRTPDVKTSPWLKEEKKKEKKPKKDKHLQNMMQFYGQGAGQGLPGADLPGPSRGLNPNLASAFGALGPSSLPNMRFPFFPNFMPSGPGLIPNNPLIPQFGGTGLPGMPFGMPGLFPGLGQIPKMRDSSPTKEKVREQLSVEINKPHCNVAPLLPKSLDISPKSNTDMSILKLPPETIAIPINDKPAADRRPSPAKEAVSVIPTMSPIPSQAATHSSSINPTKPLQDNVDEFDTVDLTSPPSPSHQLQQPAMLPSQSEATNIQTEKSEKKKDKEHKKEKKEKDKLKKKKKQKDKDRERGEREETAERKEKSKKHKKEKRKEKERMALETNKLASSNTDSVDASDSSMGSVPKLKFKFGFTGSRPNTPDVPKKIITKTKKKDTDSHSDTLSEIGSSPQLPFARESSPELAKISALITHPPKQKTHKRKHDDDLFSSDERPSTSSKHLKSPTHEAKKKKHKPVSPETATTSHAPPVTLTETRDGGGEEQKVWICPACAQVDNGTPMIGCDGCDAWYHWECVGIQVPPDVNEDWYCRACISRKQDAYSGEKKRKKKKNKDKSSDK